VRLYDNPALYDRLYAEGTKEEAEFLLTLNERHGNGGRDWLEPACGTGRYLRELSRLGQKAAGYDRSLKMLAYAKKRAPRAALWRGELTAFEKPRAFDAAFCLHNTFRHLLTERDAVSHLKRVAASLRPGGLYILGLDLTGYDGEGDEESFDDMVVMCLPPDRERRRERVVTFFRKGRETFEDAYDLRSYGRGELLKTLGATPFQLAAVYDMTGRSRARSTGTSGRRTSS
jgi:SAM-dependent methyltransferase